MVKDIKMTPEEQLVFDLRDPKSRGDALVELSKKKETSNDLAPLIWNSFGTIAVLIQEIISVYPALSPPTLSASASSRACNVVTLLQSVASHPETRALFLKADIPHYLYPLLNTTSNAKSFEFLRLTTLGVIGALVKEADSEIVDFLLEGQVIPLCLRIMDMETAHELSKKVATYIVQRIVLDDAGLQHICATPERFFGLASVLGSMVIALEEKPSAGLLKNIVLCYLRLTDDRKARVTLRATLPVSLRNGTFDQCFSDDPDARGYLQKLLDNLAAPEDGASHSGAGASAGGAPRAGPGPSRGRRMGGSSRSGRTHRRR